MTLQTSEVFGVSKEPVKSYIERPNVDDIFKESLKSDKQIVVYGASKQGKTALVSRYLPYDENIVVRLSPQTDVIDIYRNILRNNNVKLLVGESNGTQTSSRAGIGAKIRAKIPLLGSGEVKAEASSSAGESSEKQYEEIPINLELPQDVSEILDRIPNGRKIIILENFHYLTEEKQRQFAFDLRNFQELGIRFIILGVWKENNRLVQYNGDLLDRLIEVPVEPWTEKEFHQVIDKGSETLNIKFENNLKNKIIKSSFSSIGVLQELLKGVCLEAGITQWMKESTSISDNSTLERVCKNKAEDYTTRHQRALESIASGNRTTSVVDDIQPLHLLYYLVRVILSEGYQGLSSGMQRSVLQEKVQNIHHRGKDVRASDMSNLLHNLAKTQANKKIVPPIIDYDRSKKSLQIIDSTFYFFLKHADLESIAEELQNPMLS